jgi:formate hydrogenlyase regulatory protein HycA
MPVPDVIPIIHEPHYRTDTIGTYDGGQFFASVTAAYRQADWDTQRHDECRWYVVLHLFDHEGSRRSSDIRLVRAGEFCDRDASEKLLFTLLNTLPGGRFGDIAIKPFRVEFDGVIFGLIDESGRHGDSDWAELYPDRLGFHHPWNVEYDT